MYLGPLPPADSRGEVQVRSCFRHDPNPSMFINLEDGRYNDFGSDFKGDAYNFYMQMHDAPFSTAKRAVDEIVGNPSSDLFNVPVPIPDSLVEQWHQALLNSPNHLSYVMDKRGIPLETIRELKLGFDGQRYTFPIYNQYNVCVNVRRYSPASSGGDKMINYAKGYGSARLYPISALKSQVVFLHEGEWDMAIQRGKGFNAITNTAGAGTWLSQWTELFKDKIVYIVYDHDEAGINGANKVANALYGTAKKIHVVQLPLAGTPNDKDITDYYVKRGHTAEDFTELIASTPEFKLSENDVGSSETVHAVTLAAARDSKYKYKQVEFDVMVVGKDTTPFNVPSEIMFKCSMVGFNEKMCSQCQVGRLAGELHLKIGTDPSILELIKASKQQQMGLIKKKAGIPQNCGFYQAEDIASVNVEEVLLAPEVRSFSEWTVDGGKYLLQNGFFIYGSGAKSTTELDANRGYKLRGIMTPDPWQQHVTFLLTEAQPLQDTIASFKMTPEVYELLKVFQTDDVAAKFKEIHTDFEHNVTHIRGRQDLLTGIDLTYHSVLHFNFQGIPVQKGWVEFLCIGDTRTGKSETTEKIMQHYGLGEMSNAENTSFAGLVGGLQQTNDRRWFLTWGALPLNDGRLFTIDETSGMSVDDIAKMSGIRSSGIAELTKIHKERTTARTRLIWLGNPRSGRHLSSYSYGVLAIPELIGRAEDISRFDFAISASRDEVPIDLINQKISEKDRVPHKYTSDICRLLVLWAWSRTPDDVVFEDESVDLILKYAIEMGKTYSSSIPLVEGANQRIKLAKLAVAAAARVFSTDSTGQKVIVKPEHVEFVYRFLEEIYSKPSLDYKGYSARELADARIAEQHREEVVRHLEGFPDIADLFDRQEYVWPKHLEEQLGCSRESVQEHIAFLTRTRMIYDANNRGYRKTAAFIQILREFKYNKKL